jgi:nitrogen PTS system EIIA component
MDLSHIILPEHVFIEVPAPGKWRALRQISARAAHSFSLDENAVFAVLEAREKLGSTGIGNGIAVPHAAMPGLEGPRGLIVRFSQPVDFEAIDDVPTDLAFVLLFGENSRNEYLNVLASIARRLQTEGVLAGMRQAKTVEELYSTFMEDSLRSFGLDK